MGQARTEELVVHSGTEALESLYHLPELAEEVERPISLWPVAVPT